MDFEKGFAQKQHENIFDVTTDLVAGENENYRSTAKNLAIAGNEAKNLTESLIGIQKNECK